MKVRTVMVSLEVDSDIKLKDLRNPNMWKGVFRLQLSACGVFDVQQVQVNVVQDKKKKK